VDRRSFLKALSVAAGLAVSRTGGAQPYSEDYDRIASPAVPNDEVVRRVPRAKTAAPTQIVRGESTVGGWSLEGLPSMPLWMRRGKDTYQFDAASPDGYRAAMWLLRDVQAGRMGYPHPKLLEILSFAQSWLAANSFHSLFDATSGLRVRATNNRTEGAAQSSLHLPTPEGWFFATDFRAQGLDAPYTAKLMELVGMGGVGLYWQRDFVHADVGRVRRWQGK
jgi:uncharacterized protein YcbK (DUF882 family)